MAAIHCARLGQFTQDDVQLLCSFFRPRSTGRNGNSSSTFPSFFLLQVLRQAQFRGKCVKSFRSVAGPLSAGIVSIALHNVVPTLVAAILSSLTPPVKELNDEVRSSMSVKLSTDSKYTIALH